MIKGSNLKLGITATAVTGGTDTVVVSLGDSLTKHEIFIPESGKTQRTRKSVDFSVAQPRTSANSPGGSTQGRSAVILRFPIVLDNGDITNATARIELARPVEMSSDDFDEMRSLAVQALADTDYDDLWNHHALA